MSTSFIVLDHHEFNLEEKYFSLNGEQYEYMLAYSTFGLNERIVEIPLMCKYIQNAKGKNVLEVGSVFSLLLKGLFDVVDLTEVGPGIINLDIVDYQPGKKYDLIFSISTIEHFGRGDYGDQEDEKKLKKAIDHIISLLSDGGVFVATIPTGWNKQLDRLIVDKSLPFQEIYAMKRVSVGVWKQTEITEVMEFRYDFPFKYANGICICVFENRG